MTQQYKLGRRATTVGTRGGFITVTYHRTDIVKFDTSKIILNSGSWHTATTKTRMNQASNQFGLGFRVYQKDYAWFVCYKNQDLEFLDYMVLDR